MRITIASIKRLDNESCRMLGAFLKRKNINVIISQIVDSQEISKMFKKLDTDNKGYLNRQQFDNARTILTLSDSFNEIEDNETDSESSINEIRYGDTDIETEMDEKTEPIMTVRGNSTVSVVFDRLAVRKDYNSNNRDRVYFIDFCDSFTKAKQKNFVESKYDITSIKYPMKFIFVYLAHCVQHFFMSQNKKSQELIDLGQLTSLPNTPYKWSSRINSLNLFYFLLGLRDENNYDLVKDKIY